MLHSDCPDRARRTYCHSAKELQSYFRDLVFFSIGFLRFQRCFTPFDSWSPPPSPSPSRVRLLCMRKQVIIKPSGTVPPPPLPLVPGPRVVRHFLLSPPGAPSHHTIHRSRLDVPHPVLKVLEQ